MKQRKSGFSALFALLFARTAPGLTSPSFPEKKGCYYRYTGKAIHLARRRQEEKSPEFREKYDCRAGVEATMSEFDRRTVVKHLRVRGLQAVWFAAFM